MRTQANPLTKVTQPVEPGVNNELLCPIPSRLRQTSCQAELTEHVSWQLGVAPVVEATTTHKDIMENTPSCTVCIVVKI